MMLPSRVEQGGVVPDDLSPTPRRWDLGRALRSIREAQGKTIEQVSADLSELYVGGFSAAKISRLETAKRGASPRDVRDLCDYYGVDPTERDHLVTLARAAKAENYLQGVPEAYVEYVALETLARTVLNYEPVFVPGLLQTADYFRALIDQHAVAGLGAASPESREAQARVRLERQRLLYGEAPLTLHAIIDENVLRRRVGSAAVMAAQLGHLVEMSRRPNIVLQLMPVSSGVYPGCESAGITLLEFKEGESTPDIACLLEGYVGSVWAERSADKARIARTFQYLEANAWDADQTRNFITDAMRRFEQAQGS
jgi:transcriptional regulator with XRE-family HTH domain